jgi:multisubunit Na+/H+ antiporter MnhE subunit
MSGTTPWPLRWAKRLLLALRLLGRFAVELMIANLEQARLVLGVPLLVRPRWIEYHTCLQSHTLRTLLGSLISLTPGTLTCDLEGDILLIHALNATTDDEAAGRIRRRFESLLVRWEDA